MFIISESVQLFVIQFPVSRIILNFRRIKLLQNNPHEQRSLDQIKNPQHFHIRGPLPQSLPQAIISHPQNQVCRPRILHQIR